MVCVIPSRRVLAKGPELFRLNPTRTVSRDTPKIGGRILGLSPPRLCLNAYILRQPDITVRGLPQTCASGYVRLCILEFLYSTGLPGTYSLSTTR
jgi:hypothetical protein